MTHLRETVADHLSDAFFAVDPRRTVGEIIDALGSAPREVELVCAVGRRGRLIGALPARALLAQPRHIRFAQAMRRDPPFARLDEDQEHAASAALHHGVEALPVVGPGRRLVGVIGPGALMQVLRREHVEDLHRLAGIQREGARARHAIEDPPLRRLGHRLPWLVAGLAGSGVATAVMAAFEARLAANVAVAFFVPAIVYLADAVGTQSEAIAVRGLSLTRAGIRPLLAGEIRVGTLLGACLGALALPPTWFAFGDLRLALAVAAAIWTASTLAATLGLLFPWALARAGVDPAHGSGPLATVVQDVLSILAYFAVVAAFDV